MESFVKQLNNRLIKWENLYGFFWNECYDENGYNRKFKSEIEEEQSFKALDECRAVMEELQWLKRNMYYSPKKMEKRKYKIEKLPRRTKEIE